MTARLLSAALFLLLTASSCSSPSVNQRVLDFSGEPTLERRSHQTRVFETADKERVMRAVLATLQDLGFLIDQANLNLGTVSAIRMDGKQARVTVSVRQRGPQRMEVRANAQYGRHAVGEPAAYQDFFSSLSKTLFLQAAEE